VLRSVLNRIRPTFSEGGRLEKLYPLYEMADTFLYTQPDVTHTASHVRDGLDLKRMMVLVVVALGPCFYMALHNTGYQANLQIAAGTGTAIPDWREAVFTGLGLSHDPNSLLSCFVYGALWFLPAYIVTMAVGGTIELIFALVRGHEINEGFLVTGMLYPLTLPPTTPLLIVASGSGAGLAISRRRLRPVSARGIPPTATAGRLARQCVLRGRTCWREQHSRRLYRPACRWEWRGG